MNARTAFLICLAAVAAALASGCSRNKERGVAFRRDISVNLAKPQKNWPGDPRKTLTPAQQDVLSLRGRPDFIRFHWKGGEEFAGDLEVPRDVKPEELAAVPQSWVYLRQGDEVSFPSSAQYQSDPISDRLKVVIKEGDPEDSKYIPTPAGGEEEEWHYFSSGMVYRFRNGKLVDAKRQHDPIHGYMKH
ncbi:MAG: hypothetical protein NTW86_08320 [Candidatus Sumerlaeota bacterium]|nr:hypothetical protein [Candidatus Sumerlaeota bacterium]